MKDKLNSCFVCGIDNDMFKAKVSTTILQCPCYSMLYNNYIIHRGIDIMYRMITASGTISTFICIWIPSVPMIIMHWRNTSMTM